MKKILKKIYEFFSNLFKPEEVEVTFTANGKTTRYKYKKLNNKVA